MYSRITLRLKTANEGVASSVHDVTGISISRGMLFLHSATSKLRSYPINTITYLYAWAETFNDSGERISCS